METKENTIVVPMPKTKEYTAIIGEDNEVKAYLVKARKNGLGVNWVAIYQTALEWLAKTNLQNQEYRVLMYLMSKLDFENYIRVTQTSIADALKIKQSNVSRAIRGLIDHDILIVGPHAGTAKTYRLNPRMAYKGKNPKNAIIEYDVLRKQHVKIKNRRD